MAQSRVHLHVLLLVIFTVCECSVEINGAGASFPFDVYSAWLSAYSEDRSRWLDLSMHYESVGSGVGLARIKGETGPAVAYAGSESVLNDTEYADYPDLQMFPSIGGAIVMAFNLPGVINLNLKMSDIVGIYNGSIDHWNHSSLVDSNPGTKMPAQPIHVTARRDKSGTTEVYTSCLSASDQNWNKTFGTFSEGLREDDVPYVWDPQVVTLFGETNRGVSGLILSTKYSIGYLSLTDAVTGQLSYARLQNKAGNFVDASPANVKSSMDDFADSFTDRMTTSLANPPGADSYPIARYTYLIVRKTTMEDCVVARDLVRYIEWFYTDIIPRTECENLHMVPVTRTVSSLVIHKVLKMMTCQGHNVYSLVVADRQYEEIASQEWRLPVFITVPIFSLLFICLLLYMVRDQLRLNRALLRNEWKINNDTIVFDHEQDIKNNQSFASTAAMNGSRNKVYPSISSVDSDNSRLQAMSLRAGFRTGKWQGRRVLLAEQYVLSRGINWRMRRGILWMRDQVRHANISEFYGLLLLDGLYSTVSNYCSKGDLQNLLHRTRYNIDNNFKFALCLGVAKGMAYLHSQKLIHGSLTSSKIFIDDLWSVRVSSWEAHTLASYQGKSLPPPDMGIDEWAKEEFWTAPELLKGRTPPTTHSDIYSFAIIMQEIFSRDIPYAEQSGFQSPRDTLEQIVTISLRPVFTADTPLGARGIMQRAWDMDPLARPSFQSIVGSIRKDCPKIRSVMDSMMDSLTQYVGELEENIQMVHRSLNDKEDEKMNTPVDENQAGTNKTEVLSRFWSLPPDVARVLGHKQLQTELYECVTVLVSCLHGMDKLIRVSTPQDIADMLTDLHQALDLLLGERSDVLKVHVLNDSCTLVTGLPQRTCDHLKTMATLALSMLSLARSFKIRHRREDRLRMRIGLSTGSVVAGLVGSKPCRLLVVGEALTRANSMAATSLPMTIQMPEATFTQVSALRTFTCVERKSTAHDQDKRQLVLKSYWLIGSKTMGETFYPESL